MKPLNLYIQEKLIINKNYKPYACCPKTRDELRKIIADIYDELGPGTKQNHIDFNDVDVSNINSFYNVNMNIGIFEGTNFEYIDISKWDVSNVKDMFSMFSHCEVLKSVGDLSNWNVSKVEDMRYMFRRCKQLKSVGDLSKWKVSKVKNINGMFRDSGITNIPDWYKE